MESILYKWEPLEEFNNPNKYKAFWPPGFVQHYVCKFSVERIWAQRYIFI